MAKHSFRRDGGWMAIAFCIALASTSAVAANWVSVGDSTLRRYSVDVSSIGPTTEGAVKVSIKLDRSRDPSANFKYSLSGWEFRCASHSMRIYNRANYAKNNALLETEQYPDAQFSDIVPQSMEQAIEKVVCAHAPAH